MNSEKKCYKKYISINLKKLVKYLKARIITNVVCHMPYKTIRWGFKRYAFEIQNHDRQQRHAITRVRIALISIYIVSIFDIFNARCLLRIKSAVIVVRL